MSKVLQESLGLPVLNDLFNHTEKSLLPKEELVDSSVTLNDDEQANHEESMVEFAELAQAKAEDLIELGYSIDPKSAGSVMGAAAKFMSLALDAKRSIRDTQLQMAKLQIEAMKIAKMPNIMASTNQKPEDAPLSEAKPFDRNQLIQKVSGRALSSDE